MVIQYGNVMYTRSSARGNTGETCSTSRHRRTRCVHTPPCIPWRARTDNDVPICCSFMAHEHTSAPPRRRQRHARPPAAPTSSLAATSAPCCSSVCTTAACPREEAKCKLVSPTFWRTGVRSAAGPQRQERPRQAAKLSRAGHPALRTRTSTSILQQVVAWAPSRAMHPPRQCMRTWP